MTKSPSRLPRLSWPKTTCRTLEKLFKNSVRTRVGVQNYVTKRVSTLHPYPKGISVPTLEKSQILLEAQKHGKNAKFEIKHDSELKLSPVQDFIYTSLMDFLWNFRESPRIIDSCDSWITRSWHNPLLIQNVLVLERVFRHEILA